MWTINDIFALRLKLGMTHFQFAKKLGVSVPTAQMWEKGVPPLPFDEAKLDNLNRQASSYLADMKRLREMRDKHMADQLKSEYITELLPNGKGIVSVKRK